MWVANTRGERFGKAGRCEVARERQAVFVLLIGERDALELFVDDKVESRLGDAKVRGRDAFVKAEWTFLAQYLVDDLESARAASRLVHLQTRLHEPNRIGDGDRCEAGHECRTDVQERTFLAHLLEQEVL